MLVDQITGESREVDIVAEADIAGYPVVLSIEVRDRGRAADVTWVESMAQKHADLQTSKLVLWSSTGFTKSALKKAKALKIETVTPLGLDEAPWAKIGRDMVASTVKYVSPKFKVYADVTKSDGTVERWTPMNDDLLCQIAGSLSASVGAVVEQVSNSPQLRSTLLDHAPTGSGSFHALYTPPFPCTLVGSSGELAEVSQLVFDISTICEIAVVTTKSIVHNGVATTLLEAGIRDGTLQFALSEPATGSSSMKVRHTKI